MQGLMIIYFVSTYAIDFVVMLYKLNASRIEAIKSYFSGLT